MACADDPRWLGFGTGVPFPELESVAAQDSGSKNIFAFVPFSQVRVKMKSAKSWRITREGARRWEPER